MAEKKRDIVNKVGEIGQDNLFAHVYPPARIIPIVLVSSETPLKRGAILYEDNGKFKHVDEANKAKARAILKDDVDKVTDEAPAFAYATGDFNVHAVFIKPEAKIDETVRYALMDHQIYLSELQG